MRTFALLVGFFVACGPQSKPDSTGKQQQEPLAAADPECGGIAAKACPAHSTCKDDPADTCDPAKGGADCAGICVQDTPPKVDDNAKACGGFAGLACPEGFTCVDDPRDSCDPAHGGADCIGVCLQPA
jgi:hypothetical protein